MTIKLRLEEVLREIDAACSRSNRDAGDVRLVAVSKTHPVEAMLEYRLAAGELGIPAIFGENYVQEFRAKAERLSGIETHFIGSLQRNKARDALELFTVIESVHSFELLVQLEREAAKSGVRAAVLLQVNISEDPGKHGFRATDLLSEESAERLTSLEHVELRGLMTITRAYDRPEDARGDFRALRALSEELRGRPFWTELLGAELSMGMSADFAVAVEEGATIIRVGTRLFGER